MAPKNSEAKLMPKKIQVPPHEGYWLGLAVVSKFFL